MSTIYTNASYGGSSKVLWIGKYDVDDFLTFAETDAVAGTSRDVPAESTV